MKKTLMKLAVVLLCMTCSVPAMAQFNLKKAVGGAVKAAKAVTLTDEQMREYVKNILTGWTSTIRYVPMMIHTQSV